MADITTQPPSRLSILSASFRDENLVRNNCCHGYTCGNEYCAGSKDVISDGDCRGRDPKDGSASATIGTNIDIETRNCLIAKNACRYTPGTRILFSNSIMLAEAKILFENIKNLRHLLSEGVGGNSIVDAINNHEWIYLYYTGDEKTPKGYRTVRPYVLGTSKAGNKVLRAFQDNPKNSYHFDNKATRPDSEHHDYWVDSEGEKPGWRMFRVDKISKIYPIGQKFHDSNGVVMIPAGYHEGGDKDMTSIEAYVSTMTKPVSDYTLDKKVQGAAGLPKKELQWDSIRKGNKNKRKITSNDVIKLRDLASKFHKKSLSRYMVVIDDKNNFQLVTANDIKSQKIPETAIVGSLPYLYDSIVKANAPADDKFFNDIKNKTKAEMEQKKQKEMEKGFQTIQEVEKNSPSIPFERKTFFKQ